MTPRPLTSILGVIEQSPALMAGTGSGACVKREVNDFSLLWVIYKHVTNIPGHDILDTKSKIL